MENDIKNNILNAGKNPNASRNSMGVSESFYDPYYLIKSAFTIEEINAMDEKTLQAVFKVADFATEIFY